jgi:hypothetical protein
MKYATRHLAGPGNDLIFNHQLMRQRRGGKSHRRSDHGAQHFILPVATGAQAGRRTSTPALKRTCRRAGAAAVLDKVGRETGLGVNLLPHAVGNAGAVRPAAGRGGGQRCRGVGIADIAREGVRCSAVMTDLTETCC